jgi:transposase
MQTERRLETRQIGAMPLLNKYIEECDLRGIFDRFVPSPASSKIPTSSVLLFLLRNIMLSSFPLYRLADWARDYSPDLLGLTSEQTDSLNDDRIGRELERFFLADRSTMATVLALRIIKFYAVEINALHNDSTSISFHGDYNCEAKFNKKPAALRRGFSKNHRPDLKQLVFNLVVSNDGAVPIHYMLHDGNVTDDTTHVKTWDGLREIVGHPGFIYVADSKLCTVKNMAHISEQGGRFITVLPQTRKEYQEFMQWIESNPVRGEALRYRSDNAKASDHYRGYESPDFISQEGFRIIWIRSSQKKVRDAQTRKHRLETVEEKLTELSGKINKYSLKEEKDICAQAEKILRDNKMEDCFRCRVKPYSRSFKKNLKRGRPGPDSIQKTVTETLYKLEWSMDKETVKKKAHADGFFPLITNIEELDMRTVLKHYKYQPRLEKRHSHLKSVLEVAPLYLKSPERIEALLFLYYLALAIYALIERDMKKAMVKSGLKSIPIYPEKRECKRPSAERILDQLKNTSMHELWEDDELIQIFHSDLSDLQINILKLLDVSAEHYGRE